MENLKVYNKYKSVPEEALKDFDNGKFKGTDINSMWRIKCLTEEFGMCGIGWYYDIIRLWNEQGNETTIISNAEIKLFIKVDGEWSKGISGIGGNIMEREVKGGYITTNDECYKMAVTDAIGNACKSLGFGADVYWQNDKTKYTAQQTEIEIVGGTFKLTKGKHANKTLAEIWEIDKDYINWCYNSENCTKELKENIKMFLEHKESKTNE